MDLHSRLAVPLWDCLLGCTATVATLHGTTAHLSIPPGTQHGAVITLLEAGVRRGGGKGTPHSHAGSHHFQVQVLLPKELSKAEQHLLEELARLHKGEAAMGGGVMPLGLPPHHVPTTNL